jgi:hypothetical protein
MKALKKPEEKIEIPPELSIQGQILDDKHVILMRKYFTGDNFRRVFKCQGGFGCHPDTMGSAVFGTLISNGTSFRSERYEIERLATEEEVKQAEEIREKEKKLLVKFRDNWSDEFIVEGFKLFTGLEWKEFKEKIESESHFPAKGYFGTNDFLEFVDIKDYFEHFEAVDILQHEYETIRKLFPKGYALFIDEI